MNGDPPPLSTLRARCWSVVGSGCGYQVGCYRGVTVWRGRRRSIARRPRGSEASRPLAPPSFRGITHLNQVPRQSTTLVWVGPGAGVQPSQGRPTQARVKRRTFRCPARARARRRYRHGLRWTGWSGFSIELPASPVHEGSRAGPQRVTYATRGGGCYLARWTTVGPHRDAILRRVGVGAIGVMRVSAWLRRVSVSPLGLVGTGSGRRRFSRSGVPRGVAAWLRPGIGRSARVVRPWRVRSASIVPEGPSRARPARLVLPRRVRAGPASSRARRSTRRPEPRVRTFATAGG